MTISYTRGAKGTVAGELINQQPINYVAGTPTAAPGPSDAYASFQKMVSHGMASSGTFTANGTSTVTVADVNMTTTSIVLISLKTVGGTVGAIPTLKTITAGTGFTVAGTASDTSVYNYVIFNYSA